MKTLPYARKQEILEMLKENDFVDVDRLSKKFEVSYMTINRDLKELEESGAVSRVYGGVKAAESKAPFSVGIPQKAKPVSPDDEIRPYFDLTIEERFNKCIQYKQAIAEKAASFVEDGEVIAMDPSTTVLHMCTFLQNKTITVVTTSLMVALQFSNSKSVTVLLLGGVLRKPSLSVIGSQLEDMLDRVVISKCFLSSHAFSFENGLTDLTIEESDAKKKLISRSGMVYVLVDNTKINYNASFNVCRWREIDAVLTDSEENLTDDQKNCLKKFNEHGVEIIYSM